MRLFLRPAPGHRTLLSSRLVTKSGNNVDLNTAQVHYDR
jgi:hypothetical protein